MNLQKCSRGRIISNKSHQDVSNSSCIHSRIFEDKSGESSVRRQSKNRLSTSHRWFAMTFFIAFTSILSVSQSFSPVVDTRSNRKLTSLQVVETKSPEVSSFSPSTEGFSVSIVASGDELYNENEEKRNAANENETVEDKSQDDSDAGDEDDEKARRLAKASQAASLLSRRSSSPNRRPVGDRTTSVGARRTGSASKARTGERKMTKLADAFRKAAGANASEKNADPSVPKTGNDANNTPSATATKSLIRATVEGMLMSSGSHMGLFGNPAVVQSDLCPQMEPAPGTVLLSPGDRQTSAWKPASRVTVRVSSTPDDSEIANLRLSVFSAFPPDIRKTFTARSCQVLSNRRNRGATCVVATVPRYASMLDPRPDLILGTAECSLHEFHGTALGRRRPKNSIMYVTEVAVSPTSRRKGVGNKIMKVSLAGNSSCRFRLKTAYTCYQNVSFLPRSQSISWQKLVGWKLCTCTSTLPTPPRSVFMRERGT